MINSDLTYLRDSPFGALRTLLDPLAPAPGLTPALLTIGEPQHTPPQLMIDALRANEHLFGKYPPIDGKPELRRAITGWLALRYEKPETMMYAVRTVSHTD